MIMYSPRIKLILLSLVIIFAVGTANAGLFDIMVNAAVKKASQPPPKEGETAPGLVEIVLGTAVKENASQMRGLAGGMGGVGGAAMNGLATMQDHNGDEILKNKQTPRIQNPSAQGVGSSNNGEGNVPNAATIAKRRAIALECKNTSKQDTGNLQVDTGCSIVAFDVCIYQNTNLTAYNQEATIECKVLQSTFGSEVCSKPCNVVQSWPVSALVWIPEQTQ